MMIRAAELLEGPPLLKVEVIRDANQFASMRGEWGALLTESKASLFNSWEWMYPWFLRVGSGRELHLLTARDRSNRLVGLMPLCADVRGIAGTSVRRLAFLGETEVDSDDLDLVARAEDHVRVAHTFARHLLDRAEDWDLLDLVDVPSGSPTLSAFRRLFRIDPFQLRFAHRTVRRWEQFPSGDTFDAWLDRTGRRQNYLRRIYGLLEQPGLRIEKGETPDEVLGQLAEVSRLRVPGWSEASEQFQQDVARLLSEKRMARIYVLRSKDEALAAVYGLVHRDGFICYQSGFVPAYRGRGLASALTGEVLRDALGSGIREFAFPRSPRPSRCEWSTHERFTLSLRIFRRDGIGAWLARGEDAAGAAVAEVRRRVFPVRPRGPEHPSWVQRRIEPLVKLAHSQTELHLRARIRGTVKKGLHRAGFHFPRPHERSEGAVVLFHHKIQRNSFGMWGERVVDVDTLEQQLAFLTRKYEIVPLSHVVQAIRGEVPFPRRAVVLTFDDGYRSNLLRAAPLLKRYGVPATLFVSTGLVGTRNWMWGYEVEEMLFRYSPLQFAQAANHPVIHAICSRDLPRHVIMLTCVEYLKTLDDARRQRIVDTLRKHLPVEIDEENSFLSWDEVRELRPYGFEYGAHSVTHRILPRSTGAEMLWEIAESRNTLERELGIRPTMFSYPNGDTNPFVTDLVRRHYEAAVVTVPGRCVPGTPLLEIPRLFAEVSPADLAFAVNRQFQPDDKPKQEIAWNGQTDVK